MAERTTFREKKKKRIRRVAVQYCQAKRSHCNPHFAPRSRLYLSEIAIQPTRTTEFPVSPAAKG